MDCSEHFQCVPSVPDAIEICFVVSDGYSVPILIFEHLVQRVHKNCH
jgi:hypothetical protein